MSLSADTEFQPSSEFANDPKLAKTLHRMLEDADAEEEEVLNNPYTSFVPYVEGEKDYYARWAQAWRYIGFYIDCTVKGEEEEEEGEGRKRHLESGDEDQVGCTRFLLWAAYVDPYYSGGGLYEYQFYDRDEDAYTSYCADEDNCRKMDCHESDTNFQLLGFFKHADYYRWMEQLFKHEGYCIWSDDEYNLMGNAYDNLPLSCTATEAYDENNRPIYYAIRPVSGGDIDIGLYTDADCRYDYYGDQVDVNDLAFGSGDNSHSGSGDEYETVQDYLDAFNDAFSIFKVCQPCLAYTLGADDFYCYDDAGYENVNQCMKFRTKCVLQSASLNDVARATEQGTTKRVDVMGQVLGTGKYKESKIIKHDENHFIKSSIFIASFLVFCFGVYAFYVVKKYTDEKTAFERSFMERNGGMLA